MEKDRVILPKGTIVKIEGLPCELSADTEIISPTIAKMGLDWVKNLNPDSVMDLSEFFNKFTSIIFLAPSSFPKQ